MRRAAAATIAVELMAGSLTPAWVPAAELSAAEIVAKSVAARGGLDAWRKVETMVWVGHIESAHAPMPGMQFELDQARPNKTRLEIRAPGYKALRVFDGTHGWKLRPAAGRPEVEPFTPQEIMFAQAGHGIDGPLIDHAAKGSVTLESVDEIGGRKGYHLKLRRARGGTEDVWVDTETYLDIRHDRMADGPAGAPRRVSVTYGDYRTVEGLRIPFLIATGGGPGTTPDKMQIETVVLNAPLADSSFGNPTPPRSHMPPSVVPQGRASPAPSSATTAASEERGSARP